MPDDQFGSSWLYQPLVTIRKNSPELREQRKKLTTLSLHEEFIKGSYEGDTSLTVERCHGYPPHCMVG